VDYALMEQHAGLNRANASTESTFCHPGQESSSSSASSASSSASSTPLLASESSLDALKQQQQQQQQQQKLRHVVCLPKSKEEVDLALSSELATLRPRQYMGMKPTQDVTAKHSIVLVTNLPSNLKAEQLTALFAQVGVTPLESIISYRPHSFVGRYNVQVRTTLRAGVVVW
jgi:hypothetical protein